MIVNRPSTGNGFYPVNMIANWNHLTTGAMRAYFIPFKPILVVFTGLRESRIGSSKRPTMSARGHHPTALDAA